MGTDDYMVKLFNPEDLVGRVDRLLKMCGKKGKALEVGLGLGDTTWLLRRYGLEVTTQLVNYDW